MRRIVLLLALALAFVAAQSANAELKHYNLLGDNVSVLPGVSPSIQFEEDEITGFVIIRDKSDGSPTMVHLRAIVPFEEDVVNVEPFTMLPGGRSTSRNQHTEGKPFAQAGTGSTSGTLDWGIITGWTASGFAFCQESPQLLFGSGLCAFAAWTSGTTITPHPSRGIEFDTGVWTFTGDMSSFEALPSFLYQTFVAGGNNTIWKFEGELASIPALPLLGAGALGAALVYLGVRAVRRPKE